MLISAALEHVAYNFAQWAGHVAPVIGRLLVMMSIGSSVVVGDTPFQGFAPTSYLWVKAGAAPGGDGSAERPFATIQAGVDAARPGAAVMVQEGSYHENVKLPSVGAGTADRPLMLVSADGAQKARVYAADQGVSTIRGFGTDNVVVKGFEVHGGKNGIQFSQSGSDFTNTVSRVVIIDNVVVDAVEDGVKISQADGVFVIGNDIRGSGEEGIDFVAVNHSVIADNHVSDSDGAAAIFAKGGSTDVLITSNQVQGAAKDGIIIGGWTESAFFRPGFDTYEARNVTVTGNRVEGVEKRPLNVLGGVDSKATGNVFGGADGYYAAIGVGRGKSDASTPMYSRNVEITGNTVTGGAAKVISIDSGNAEGVSSKDNSPATITPQGPDGSASRALSAFEAPSAANAEAVRLTPLDTWSTGAKTVATIKGAAGGEAIKGTSKHEQLDGGSGSDTMAGGGGDDLYIASGSGDKIVEAAGQGVDTVYIYSGGFTLSDNVENLYARKAVDMKLIGNAQANIVSGSGGADTLEGRGGADQLIGGQGRDVMTGGTGGDTFVWSDRAEIGQGDVITDFDIGLDRLDLRGLGLADVTFRHGSDGLSVLSSGGEVVVLLQGLSAHSLMSGSDYLA